MPWGDWINELPMGFFLAVPRSRSARSSPGRFRFDDEDETAELEPGDTFEREFAEAGSFHYVCTLHPQDMEGEVRVSQ